MQPMYYIGLDVHKRKISYCVKDSGGQVYAEGAIPATRFDLDRWMKTLPLLTCAPPQRVGRALALLTKTYHGSRLTGNLAPST
jgi:hypothetical protein